MPPLYPDPDRAPPPPAGLPAPPRFPSSSRRCSSLLICWWPREGCEPTTGEAALPLGLFCWWRDGDPGRRLVTAALLPVQFPEMPAFLEACKEDQTLLSDLVPALHCRVLSGLLFVNLEHPRPSSFPHPSVCRRGVVQSSLGPTGCGAATISTMLFCPCVNTDMTVVLPFIDFLGLLRLQDCIMEDSL